MAWTEFTFALQPSPVSGIGIFATHDIPAGTQVFAGDFFPRKMKTKEIPAEFHKYCVFLDDEECLCPKRFDCMEIAWHVNHSNQPNITKKADNDVVTTRDIKAGEEIFLDYNQLNEPEHLKDSYYS